MKINEGKNQHFISSWLVTSVSQITSASKYALFIVCHVYFEKKLLIILCFFRPTLIWLVAQFSFYDATFQQDKYLRKVFFSY